MIHYATILDREDDGYKCSCDKCGCEFYLGPMSEYKCECGLRWTLDVSATANDGIEPDDDE